VPENPTSRSDRIVVARNAEGLLRVISSLP
jgi:hypothetical protein